MSAKLNRFSLNQIITYLTLISLLALGLWLRWRFIEAAQLYPDEFVTLLAVQMIGEKGLPLMPSGLFYEHGLLFSYLGYIAAWFGPPRLAVRVASLLCGGLTLLLTFWLGRRWFSPAVGLMAAAGLALAPAAIQWSGRARMYALLQLLVLLALWLAYEGFSQNKALRRWAALLVYFGALLTQFAAVALAPPLALAGLLWGRPGRTEGREISQRGTPGRDLFRAYWRSYWPELLTFSLIIGLAFLVKRLGQPRGIEPMDTNQPLAGLVQVLAIYSDFSLNILAGWQAIAPFYLSLPALLYTPFALIAAMMSLVYVWHAWQKPGSSEQPPARDPGRDATPAPLYSHTASRSLFLSIMLLVTTLEMIFVVSSERRDDKYLFMLLPVLFLLGAQGLSMAAGYLFLYGRDRFNPQFAYSAAALLPVLVSVIILGFSWQPVQVLLANTGDDYDAAFAYIQENWQAGDQILTGTPPAAAFYLGYNDFYSVQRRGGYDYRVLTVNGQAVDRWLASPAIRTEAELHQTLAGGRVWLVLERWGLQREYYDLPFQQQLLAQTEYITEAQGIFILRSKPNPQPLRPDPAQSVPPAHFTGPADPTPLVQLAGYTVEPRQASAGQTLRLTLYWQALTPLPHDYTVFVHLREPAGGTVAQADHRPLAQLYPTSLWPPGELIRESSELSLPGSLPAGHYELWTGLYRLETGERLPVQNDTSGENAVQLGSMTVE